MNAAHWKGKRLFSFFANQPFSLTKPQEAMVHFEKSFCFECCHVKD
jgi:hypothetical protein